MFETHQQEAKTARDKRDREEIEQLKKQVQCLTLEHRQYWLLGDRSILTLQKKYFLYLHLWKCQ